MLAPGARPPTGSNVTTRGRPAQGMIFMHCLPALRNTETKVGRQMHGKWDRSALAATAGR